MVRIAVHRLSSIVLSDLYSPRQSAEADYNVMYIGY